MSLQRRKSSNKWKKPVLLLGVVIVITLTLGVVINLKPSLEPYDIPRNPGDPVPPETWNLNRIVDTNADMWYGFMADNWNNLYYDTFSYSTEKALPINSELTLPYESFSRITASESQLATALGIDSLYIKDPNGNDQPRVFRGSNAYNDWDPVGYNDLGYIYKDSDSGYWYIRGFGFPVNNFEQEFFENLLISKSFIEYFVIQ